MYPQPFFVPLHISIKKYTFWFAGMLGYICIWWLWLWPGQMGWDTAGYLRYGLEGKIDSYHSHLYSFLINTLAIPRMRVSLLAGIQAIIASIVLARLYATLWATRPPIWAKIWGLLVLFSPLTPVMAVFINGDGIFSFAMLGLLFESWLIACRGKSTTTNWILIACYAPLALFLRDNGKILALLLPLLTWSVYQRNDWKKLTAILVVCLILGSALSAILVQGKSHPVFLPMVSQEIAGFSLPLPRQATGETLSAETKELLVNMGTSPEQLAVNYHPYYWDFVGFAPGGPQLLNKPDEQVRSLIRSFFTRDLWKNLPRFIGHRTEVFLAMCLVKSTHLDPALRFPILAVNGIQLKDRQASRLPDWANSYVEKIYKASYRYRWLFWNALPAVFLLALLCIQSGLKQAHLRIILAPCAIQAAGIYCLAPAAEYRYVFPLFICAPLLLLAWNIEKTKIKTNPANDKNP